jgi:hypothetical protein
MDPDSIESSAHTAVAATTANSRQPDQALTSPRRFDIDNQTSGFEWPLNVSSGGVTKGSPAHDDFSYLITAAAARREDFSYANIR